MANTFALIELSGFEKNLIIIFNDASTLGNGKSRCKNEVLKCSMDVEKGIFWMLSH